MISNLVLGRQDSPNRNACMAIAITANWIGMVVAITSGILVGGSLMVLGMVVAGVLARRAAPEPAPLEVVDERVLARLQGEREDSRELVTV